MAIPTNRAELKSWIFRKLGAPVIEINLADEQVDDRIDDALTFWQRYHIDAQRTDYIAHKMTQEDHDQHFITLDEDITAVKRVIKPSGDSGNGSDELFNIDYQLRLNDLWDLSSTNLSGYVVARQYLALLDDTLNTQVQIRYKEYDGKLYLDTSWARLAIDSYIIIECSRKIEGDRIYGDGVFRNLAAAYCRLQWGRNLSKFGGVQLPGGVVLNGPAVIEDASAEIMRLEEDFIIKYQEPDNFYVG